MDNNDLFDSLFSKGTEEEEKEYREGIAAMKFDAIKNIIQEVADETIEYPNKERSIKAWGVSESKKILEMK